MFVKRLYELLIAKTTPRDYVFGDVVSEKYARFKHGIGTDEVGTLPISPRLLGDRLESILSFELLVWRAPYVKLLCSVALSYNDYTYIHLTSKKKTKKKKVWRIKRVVKSPLRADASRPHLLRRWIWVCDIPTIYVSYYYNVLWCRNDFNR